MLEILIFGLLLGIGAAFSVGPIFVTIVQEAATRGFGAGFRVILGSAVADLILLLPAVAFIWIIQTIVGATFWVGLIGALFFLYLGQEAARDSWRLWHTTHLPQKGKGWSFWKGVIGNLANPLTWTFWLATGAPTMLHSYSVGGWLGVTLFTMIWFGVAVAIETVIALTIAQSKRIVGNRGLAVFTGFSSAMFFGLAVGLFMTSVWSA